MSVLLLRADAGRIPLADGSVHCCVTSPPYFGLRAYQGVPPTVWSDGWRGTLGNEPAVDLYVAHVVECFREVRRVLRDDGCVWIVLGDSFGQRWSSVRSEGGRAGLSGDDYRERRMRGNADRNDGQLLLVPWRVALALQVDGWIVRNDAVWAKRATMPESVRGWAWSRCRVNVSSLRTEEQAHSVGVGDGRRDNGTGGLAATPSAEWRDCPGCDRCAPSGGLVLRRGSWRHTRAHETVLMLVKSMGYYADAAAVAEPARHAGRVVSYNGTQKNTDHENRTYPGATPRDIEVGATRNPRSFMLLGPEPLAAAHYAAFPTALVEPLIRATCPERVCATCGAPWARVVERAGQPPEPTHRNPHKRLAPGQPGNVEHGNMGFRASKLSGVEMNEWKAAHPDRTLGFRPTCACDAGKPVPGTVLDPFCGAGTTLRVAVKLGRHGVGCDLSRSYLATIADRRTRDVQVEMPGSAP